MYGLPSDFDFAALEGLTVTSLTFGQYQANLNFEPDGRLQIMSAFSLSVAGGLAPVVGFPLSCTDLVILLEQRIVRATGSVGGTLVLEFEAGHVLKCFEDAAYESYEIALRGMVTLV